ncbi:hypothetical protein H310_12370 [Aphanomyces invadans]|uniref:Reverse transcriptase domain-containing protein n=1 Tax=Aphanomyces invadans TaxID=157072 RepID=A0A024TKE1_9STRA|nr:hypothetical protein H310_12370 [Aphanomyces invadans]ETV93807.1 hypothetical protein H310_12370 [Aphanomyces invadans]|eukprot:XP_008877616.1 hypothetical protein H310_12370 [Aphanomyces invadans]
MSLAQIQDFLEKSAIDSATSSSPDHWIQAQQAEWVDIQRATEACQADALWDAISKYPLQANIGWHNLSSTDPRALAAAVRLHAWHRWHSFKQLHSSMVLVDSMECKLDDSANHLLDEDALAFFELLLASQAPYLFAHGKWMVRVTAQPVEWILCSRGIAHAMCVALAEAVSPRARGGGRNRRVSADRELRDESGPEPFRSPRGRQPVAAVSWNRQNAWETPVVAPSAASGALPGGALPVPATARRHVEAPVFQPPTTPTLVQPATQGAPTGGAAPGAAAPGYEIDVDDMGWFEDRIVYNAPAIPHAPKLDGMTKEHRRQFMRKYNDYLEQVNALRTNRTKPFVMPVSACIEHATKSRVADWELRKPVGLVTEAEWIAWIRLGYDMIEDMMKVIEKNNEEWVLKAEAKMMVVLITDAIRPAGLKEMVKEVLGETHNKDLKKNMYDFVQWLREYATSYQRFVSLRPEDINPTKTPKGNAGAVRTGGGGSNKDHPVPEASDLLKNAYGGRGRGAGRGDSAGGKTPGDAAGRGAGANPDRNQGGAKKVNALEVKAEVAPSPKLACVVEGVLPLEATLFDSGSDTSVGSLGLVTALLAAGASVTMRDARRPLELQPYGAGTPPVTVTKKVKLNSVEFQTSYGPLVLRGLDLWVDDAVKDKAELADGVLAAARKQAAVWDLDALATDSPAPTAMACINRLMQTKLEDTADEDDGMQCATPLPGAVTPAENAKQEAEVWEVLSAKINKAEKEGLSEVSSKQLFSENIDVFRLEMGGDPPIKVEPLRVRVKPGAVPVKCELRRYPPLHMEYLEGHVAELERAGLVYRNNRMTIDSRPVNACAEPMPWPMPNLDAALSMLAGTSAAVNQMFGDLLFHGVLGWLDDLLGYASAEDELLGLLANVLGICGAFGLKLRPKK